MCVVGALLAPAAASAQTDTSAARQPRTEGDTARATHVVRRGDTLWDLAIAYLRDPYRWREIYEANRAVVENPHWIYPGERIRIPGRAAADAVATANRPQAPAPMVRVTSADSAGTFAVPTLARSGDPLALAARRLADYLSAPYLDRVGGPAGAGAVRLHAPTFSSTGDGERLITLGDPVQLTLPAGTTPTVGERFLTFARGEQVHGGQVVRPTGIVEVTEYEGNLVLGRVLVVLDELREAQGVMALPPAPPAAGAVAAGSTGRIVWVDGDSPLPALQHWLMLAPGSAEGLPEQADVQLYRRDAAGVDHVVGAARIVRVTGLAASAIVTKVTQPGIGVGTSARVSTADATR